MLRDSIQAPRDACVPGRFAFKPFVTPSRYLCRSFLIKEYGI